jgi:hypothetical protein
MNPLNNNHDDLPAAARGRVANRYAASGTYKATRAEREALLEAAKRAAEKMQVEPRDVRDVDPVASAVSGLAMLVLVGGLAACGLAAVIRWVWEVLS